MELPLFSFSTIANATASFLKDNKIGEGRFGPVYKVASVMTLLNQLQPAYDDNISNVALNIGLDGCAGLHFQSKICDFQTVVSCMVAADDGIEVSAGVCLRHPLKGTKGVIRGAPLLQLEVSTMYVQVYNEGMFVRFVRLFMHGDVGIVMFPDNSGVTTSHVAARKECIGGPCELGSDEGVAARHECGLAVIGTDISTFLEGQLRVEEQTMCRHGQCLNASDKVDDDGSYLLNLPPHVLEMLIMEFFVGVEYLKFRSTCKRCHLTAPLIPWNNGKASKRMQKYSVPSMWLKVFGKD
ncbi:hypothetical protein Tco_0000560 [Tanacetum coccineum]